MIVLKIIGWVLLSILALIFAALCIRVRVQAEYSSEQTSVLLQWLFLKFKLYPMDKKAPKTEENVPQTMQAPSENSPTPEAAQSSAETDGSAETAAAEPPKAEAVTDNMDVPAEQNAEAPQAPGAEEKKKDSLLKTIYNAEGVDGLITIVKKIFAYTKTLLGNSLRGVVVDELYLEVCCTRSDAAATAIYYGEVCGILFPMLGSLASRCKLKKYDVNIYPDYLARFSNANFFIRFHLTPIYWIGILCAYGLKMIFGVLVKMLVKIFLPKKKDKKQEIQINKKEKSERT